MGLNDNDATAYVSYRLTRFVCSLITCREYDATLLRSTDSRSFQSFTNFYKLHLKEINLPIDLKELSCKRNIQMCVRDDSTLGV